MLAAKISVLIWLLLLSLNSALLINGSKPTLNDKKSYIVYMGERPREEFSMSTSHRHLRVLEEAIGSKFSPESLQHSFKRSFDGFVAMLTDDEAQKISEMKNVVSVFPNEERQLDTTRSWDFMGFSQQVERRTIESDIIVGVIDSGIWPESESFNDKGFGPPPAKWKGSCEASQNFTCNNKIIGAKHYRKSGEFGPEDVQSPRDTKGHGTHTASTAAGNLVSASLYGLGAGTARGGVPSARLAIYKVSWQNDSNEADILQAFDDAIADGVDVISISIGGDTLRNYFEDSIAIGAFHAIKSGILTAASAGNRGPDLGSVRKIAPWFLSVASTNIDRQFVAKVVLGNNKIYEGLSVNTYELNSGMFPIIYGGDAPNSSGSATQEQARSCEENSLDSNLVKGKIVLCDKWVDGKTPLLAGAAGMVVRGDRPRSLLYPLPASYVNDEDDQANGKIISYINSTSSPTATIYKSTEVKNAYAPSVAASSSRGPNLHTPDILKPDIAAPGVNILAAWSPASSASKVDGDERFVPYNILSGTSMACPHVSAAAAYIKSFHPSWSPSAIMSALMTSALPMDPLRSNYSEFAYGSGFLNPLKAINPGLVYENEPTEYIKFLCGQGYDTARLRQVTNDESICSQTNNGTVWDLNYPSFAVSSKHYELTTRVFNRTVTNVGSPTSVYKGTVTVPPGINVQVNPSILRFDALGQKLSFAVTVEGTLQSSSASASLVWDDGVYQVRSPIVVFLHDPLVV